MCVCVCAHVYLEVDRRCIGARRTLVIGLADSSHARSSKVIIGFLKDSRTREPTTRVMMYLDHPLSTASFWQMPPLRFGSRTVTENSARPWFLVSTETNAYLRNKFCVVRFCIGFRLCRAS